MIDDDKKRAFYDKKGTIYVKEGSLVRYIIERVARTLKAFAEAFRSNVGVFFKKTIKGADFIVS